MSLRDVIKKFQEEKDQIAKKRAALDAREAFIDQIMKEIGVGAKKAPAAAPRKRKGGRKKRGGMTVRDAILQAVTEGGKPMPAGEIVSAAGKLSGGAEASVRTQINGLTKAGLLQQVPYAGRGFQYKIASGKPAAKPKKMVRRKKAAKKAKPKAS